jgi:condensin complex subunit 1
VRKQCLLVIVHLILNGMLKLKGEIVDILMLLLDEDESMKNQVNLFLSELNVKDNNVIYNLF